MKKAIIIGSGLGGLALAMRLQARGFQVTLMEKNVQIGGHAYPLKKKGYTFDMGPSLITATSIIEDLFKIGGTSMHDRLDLVPLDPYYRIYFHDKTFLDYSGDTDAMKAQMAQFNARDARQYDRFMEASRKIYEAVIPQKLGATPFMTLASMAKFAPRALAMGAMLPTAWFAKLFFRDFRHIFAYSFHPLFIGGHPFRAPAIYEMIPYLEKLEGVWYAKGGMYSLIEALGNVFTGIGGDIRTQCEVKEILIENRRAVGVATDQTTFKADLVISNADFIHTYRDLIPEPHRKKWRNRRLDRLGYSMSAFLLYLGIDKRYPQLKHHTLILSHRYKSLIRDIFDRKILPDDFSMYLHAPTKSDDTMAPPDCESLYVLVPVTHLQGNVDWTIEAEPFAKRILDFLEHDFGMQDLQQHLEVREIFTPEDFQKKNNSTYGSAWGVEPKLMQTAFFRPHNRSEDIRNLYIVGASTHPGAGLPGCMLTAETTENVIRSDWGSP